MFNFGSSTVTLHVLVPAAVFAVTTAFPFFFAVTLPFAETVATEFLEELHDTEPDALVSFSFADCPFTSRMDDLLIFTGFGAGVGSGCGAGSGSGCGAGAGSGSGL